MLPAADQLARAAAAARATEPQLAAARRAARDAVGVKHSGGNWLSRQLDRLTSWLADHLPDPAFSLGGGNVARLVTWMVLIAIVVGVVALLVRAAHRWRPGSAAAPRREGGPAHPQTLFDQARSRALGMAATRAKRCGRSTSLCSMSSAPPQRVAVPAGPKQLGLRAPARPQLGSRRRPGRMYAAVRGARVRVGAGRRRRRRAGGGAGRRGAGVSLRSDRSLALVLLAVLAVGLWTLRPGSDDVGPPYQLSGRGPTGLSGLGAGLREAGIAVHDSDQPTLADHGLTVVVEPYGISHDEADSWMRSLRNGATLVYASDTPDPFTQRLGIRYEAGGTVANLVPAHATFPQMTPPARVVRSASGRGGDRILSATGSGAAFAVIPVGRGTVWFLTDPVWLTNQRVAPTALPIVLPLAAAAGGSASFDRYHQSGAGHLNVLAYLPPVATLLVIEGALAVLMLVAAMLRRPGPDGRYNG